MLAVPDGAAAPTAAMSTGLPAFVTWPSQGRGGHAGPQEGSVGIGKGIFMRRLNRKARIVLLAGGLLLGGASSIVFSHCEVPCGIYGDPMRLDVMAEHVTTIEKSMI